MKVDLEANALARRLAGRAKHGPQPEDRAAARDSRAYDDAMRRDRGPTPQDRPHVDRDQMEAWLGMFSTLTERPMSLVRVDRDRRNAVVQRCRACCAEVVTRMTDAILASAHWQADLGHAIRFDYDAHRCAPVTADPAVLTNDELFELYSATEREMGRMGERVEALRAAMNARPIGGCRG